MALKKRKKKFDKIKELCYIYLALFYSKWLNITESRSGGMVDAVDLKSKKSDSRKKPRKKKSNS